jgi:hypothetical protein
MFPSWLRRLVVRPSGSPRGQRPRHSLRPQIENLEHREVPAFLPPVSYAAGTNPGGIAVGDFNGDGKDDMAVVDSVAAGSVGVLLSNGDGTFQSRVGYATTGTYPLDAAAGDLNGDGKLDLVVVGTDIEVLLGNGDGTFGAPTAYAAAPFTHSVKLGDFNSDGRLDVGTMNNNSASLLLGSGRADRLPVDRQPAGPLSSFGRLVRRCESRATGQAHEGCPSAAVPLSEVREHDGRHATARRTLRVCPQGGGCEALACVTGRADGWGVMRSHGVHLPPREWGSLGERR